jgi:hypothetical protein
MAERRSSRENQPVGLNRSNNAFLIVWLHLSRLNLKYFSVKPARAGSLDSGALRGVHGKQRPKPGGTRYGDEF